jgi:hypothetical protein
MFFSSIFYIPQETIDVNSIWRRRRQFCLPHHKQQIADVAHQRLLFNHLEQAMIHLSEIKPGIRLLGVIPHAPFNASFFSNPANAYTEPKPGKKGKG